MTTEDSSVILIQNAAEYLNRSIEKPKDEKYAYAVKNADLFGQILSVAEAFVRAPDENSAFISLNENLSVLVPKHSMDKCVNILKDLKQKIGSSSSIYDTHFPTLANVRWRVDITISSSVLSRVLEPNLVMELELSNGRRITFELSVSKFHKLRYTVASILKEMDLINNKLAAIKV